MLFIAVRTTFNFYNCVEIPYTYRNRKVDRSSRLKKFISQLSLFVYLVPSWRTFQPVGQRESLCIWCLSPWSQLTYVTVYRSTHTFLHQSHGQLTPLSASILVNSHLFRSVYRSAHICLGQCTGQLRSPWVSVMSIHISLGQYQGQITSLWVNVKVNLHLPGSM